MRDIATIYNFKEDYSSCLSILNQAYKMASHTNDNGLTNSITQSLAICYKDINNYHESKRFLLDVLPQLDPDVKSAAFSLAIDLYSSEGKLDSVLYFSNALLRVGTVYSKRKAATTLCKYFSERGEVNSALRYLKKATSLTDSINKINAVNTVAKMHFAYNYNKQEKEKIQIENKALKEKYAYVVSILILLLIIAFAIYLLERSKKRHLESQLLYVHVEKQLDESRKLIVEKDKKHKREINNLCAKNKAERCEYERRIQDVEDRLAKEIEKHKERQSKNEMIVSSIYALLKGKLAKSKNMSDVDWVYVDKNFDIVFPSFKDEINRRGTLKTEDYCLCMLVRLGFSNLDISSLMNRTASAISMKRTKLCKVLFNENGGAKDFNNYLKGL